MPNYKKELTLAEVRRSCGVTQKQLEDNTGIAQHGISRIERQSDMHVSTLDRYVTGLGGELIIMIRTADAIYTLDHKKEGNADAE